ncbi:MAG: hypothetical protein IJY22_00945 [Clostridia bacterium]|nr:hypothetical protein [Clostridia bacterium]
MEQQFEKNNREAATKQLKASAKRLSRIVRTREQERRQRVKAQKEKNS